MEVRLVLQRPSRRMAQTRCPERGRWTLSIRSRTWAVTLQRPKRRLHRFRLQWELLQAKLEMPKSKLDLALFLTFCRVQMVPIGPCTTFRCLRIPTLAQWLPRPMEVSAVKFLAKEKSSNPKGIYMQHKSSTGSVTYYISSFKFNFEPNTDLCKGSWMNAKVCSRLFSGTPWRGGGGCSGCTAPPPSSSVSLMPCFALMIVAFLMAL